MNKKIHINDLDKHTDLEGKVNVPLGTEIEFDTSSYKRIPISTVELSIPKRSPRSKIRKIKNWLIAGTIAASVLIGYNHLKKEKPQKILSEFSETIPENYVAGASHKNNTFFFGEKDPLIRDLTARKNYINMKSGKVDTEILHKTLNVLNQQSMTQLMNTSNLNNLYRAYTSVQNNNPQYEKALENLWNKKNSRWNNKFLDVGKKIVDNYDSSSSKKTTFHEYKQNIDKSLNNIIKDLKKNGFLTDFYDESTGSGHPERRRFMENYLSSINSKVIMSYFLTELFPDINPAANIVFKNKLLKEAGEEFINGIPALSDPYLSMGPGQLTYYVINDSGAPALNKYLSNHNKIPNSMDDFVTTDHHVKGSILNLKHNAINLMNRLYTNNQLTNFNNLFEDLSSDEQKKLIVGHASAAHHATSLASGRYLQHTRNAVRGLVDFADTQNMDLGRLKQYHDQSLRNYFVLKEMKKENMFVN